MTMVRLSGLYIFLLVATTVSSILISPHGGYISIDEGADFYVECIGDETKWIIPKSIVTDTARISTQSIQHGRKSILALQTMDASLVGLFQCQSNQSLSTVFLQLRKRSREMTKQIKFMGTTTNQSTVQGSDVRLNCYAQYYSEKAMDSPYVPHILWFFERRQLFNNENKYVLGTDSLLIRNFDYNDQGVYYCRAFITLRDNFLTKIYPIFVQLQGNFSEPKYNETGRSLLANNSCDGFNSYCNISNQTCPMGEIWNQDYLQCSLPLYQNQTLHIVPNVDRLNVELGRTYTIACQSNNNDSENELEWTFENGTVIQPNMSFEQQQQFLSYSLNEDKTRTLYLRLAPVFPGTYVCRRVLSNTTHNGDTPEVTRTAAVSITLTSQMIAASDGISFQSSTVSEYHVRINSTLFIACRPEFFDFRSIVMPQFPPIAHLIRQSDNHRFALSNTDDGILIDRVSRKDSGLYMCTGTMLLAERRITALYPIMVFVSDPSCKHPHMHAKREWRDLLFFIQLHSLLFL